MTRKPNTSVLRGFFDKDGKGGIEPWTPIELGMILDHQIAIGIPDDEAAFSIVRLCVERDCCVCRSYHEFFRCSSDACIETTRGVKDYAKALIEGEPDFPRDVAKVMYLLAILRARRANMSGITTISDEWARRQVRQTLASGWLSENCRNLLRKASAFLFSSRS